MPNHNTRRSHIVAAVSLITLLGARIPAQVPTLPSETPDQFNLTNDGFDYERRDVMIPMRDGVKLHTVILVPKGARARRSC